jgi:hypothetical protein
MTPASPGRSPVAGAASRDYGGVLAVLPDGYGGKALQPAQTGVRSAAVTFAGYSRSGRL